MTLKLAIIAFILVFTTSAAAALYRLFTSRKRSSQSIDSFLLGGKQLGRLSVVNLLLSSSFGLNALFYSVWLGYAVGIWGLLIQAAWAVSFALLTPFTDKIRSGNSLHDFLGKRFGMATKIIASFCSLIGLMYLMGWEVGIGQGAMSSLLSSSSEMSESKAASSAELLTISIVVGTLFYTVLGGLKGNAIADRILNTFKIAVIIILSIFLLRVFISRETPFMKALIPSFSTMKENLGIWGLLTSLIFNLSWQFVDNSSWQSIIAGGEKSKKETSWNLKMSGLMIFLTVGLLGTLIGVFLSGLQGITPDNIFTITVQQLQGYKIFITLALLIAFVACIMSLLDGLFLACGFTLMVDIFQAKKVQLWDSVAPSPKKKLYTIRIALVLIAFLAIWGVKYIFTVTGSNLFDFVYIVILTQLSLFGPVIIALTTDRVSKRGMWLSIIISLIVGFGCSIIGSKQNIKFLSDGAGTFTTIASVILSYLLSKRKVLNHYNG